MTSKPLFQVKKSNDKIEIIMDSRMENVDRAAQITKEALNGKHLDDHCFSTCLVLREALTNAVRHAHKYDLSKKIFYCVSVDEKSITIKIEDQGSGFDWKNAVEKEYDKTADHGRGFKIMKTYFNEVEFNEKGTIISLKKIF